MGRARVQHQPHSVQVSGREAKGQRYFVFALSGSTFGQVLPFFHHVFYSSCPYALCRALLALSAPSVAEKRGVPIYFWGFHSLPTSRDGQIPFV